MRFSSCTCGARYYVRIPRQWWMRLFFGTRLHYGCDGCGVRLFIAPPDGAWDPEATMKPQQSARLFQDTTGR